MTNIINACLLGFSLAAATSAALAAPTAAQSSDQGTRVVVAYADLNIAYPSGARALLRRIRTAATKVCGEEPDSRALAQHAIFATCRDAAVERAMSRLGAPMVTAAASGSARPTVIAGR